MWVTSQPRDNDKIAGILRSPGQLLQKSCGPCSGSRLYCSLETVVVTRLVDGVTEQGFHRAGIFHLAGTVGVGEKKAKNKQTKTTLEKKLGQSSH